MFLGCCECSGSWIGGKGKPNDASERMSVAIPCGHLFHGACLDYIRKRAKLMARWHPEQAAPASSGPDAQLRCPICGTPIVHSTVMFCPLSSCSHDEAKQDRAFHLQRKLLMRLQACQQFKDELLQASTSCAQRFQEVSELRKMSAAIHAEVAKFNTAPTEPLRGSGGSSDALLMGGDALQDEVLTAMTTPQLAAFIRTQDALLRKEQQQLADAQRLLVTKRSRYTALRQSLADLRIDRARIASERANRQAARRRAAPVTTPASPLQDVLPTSTMEATMEERADEAPATQATPQREGNPHGHTHDAPPAGHGCGSSASSPIDVDDLATQERPSHNDGDPIVVDVDDTGSDGDDDVVAWVPPRASAGVARPVPESSDDASDVDVPLVPCASRALPQYGLGTGRSLFDFPRPTDAMVQPEIGRFLQRGARE